MVSGFWGWTEARFWWWNRVGMVFWIGESMLGWLVRKNLEALERPTRLASGEGESSGLEFWSHVGKLHAASWAMLTVSSEWYRSWPARKLGWRNAQDPYCSGFPSLEHRKLTEIPGTLSQDGSQYIYPQDWGGALARRQTTLQTLQTVLRSGVQPAGEWTQHIPALLALCFIFLSASSPPTLHGIGGKSTFELLASHKSSFCVFAFSFPYCQCSSHSYESMFLVVYLCFESKPQLHVSSGIAPKSASQRKAPLLDTGI